MNTVNERLIFLLDELFKGNVSEFARVTGVPQPTLNNIVGNRMSKPSADNLERIINSIESLDANWLITGKGEMLRQDAKEGINLSNVGSGNIANAGTMSNVYPYPNKVDGCDIIADNGGVKDDKDHQIILLKEKVQHLEEMLQEKERFIQVLLKNS